MYNKSEIMKRAWKLFRTGYYNTFADTLSQAWREAKEIVKLRLQGYVQANELQVGDNIAIDGYGGYDDNSFTTEITAIRACKWSDKYIVINFVIRGSENNINVEPTEMIKRVAQAQGVNVA